MAQKDVNGKRTEALKICRAMSRRKNVKGAEIIRAIMEQLECGQHNATYYYRRVFLPLRDAAPAPKARRQKAVSTEADSDSAVAPSKARR